MIVSIETPVCHLLDIRELAGAYTGTKGLEANSNEAIIRAAGTQRCHGVRKKTSQKSAVESSAGGSCVEKAGDGSRHTEVKCEYG